MLYRISKLTPDKIPDAQRLLYSIYYEELGWTPSANNPSNLRYEDNRLRDDFESSAIWLGAYRGKTLIGCLRVMINNIEVLRYTSFPVKTPVAEVNRTAIHKSHRKSIASVLLYLSAYWYAYRNNCKRLYGAISPNAVKRATRNNWTDTGLMFKYDPTDVKYSCIVFIKLDLISVIFYLINYLLRSLGILGEKP